MSTKLAKITINRALAELAISAGRGLGTLSRDYDAPTGPWGHLTSAIGSPDLVGLLPEGSWLAELQRVARERVLVLLPPATDLPRAPVDAQTHALMAAGVTMAMRNVEGDSDYLVLSPADATAAVYTVRRGVVTLRAPSVAAFVQAEVRAALGREAELSIRDEIGFRLRLPNPTRALLMWSARIEQIAPEEIERAHVLLDGIESLGQPTHGLSLQVVPLDDLENGEAQPIDCEVGVVIHESRGGAEQELGFTRAELADRIAAAEDHWESIRETLGDALEGAEPRLALVATGPLPVASLVYGAWVSRAAFDGELVWAQADRVGLRHGRAGDDDPQSPYPGGGVHGIAVLGASDWDSREVKLETARYDLVHEAGIESPRFFVLSRYD